MLRNVHYLCGRLCQNIAKIKQVDAKSIVFQRGYSIYEPDYLETGKSKIPLYDALNIQIKGYDYPILESYQKFVHNMAGNIGLEVVDGWGVPPQKLKIQKFKPQSTIIDTEYDLSIYERNIQIVDVPNTLLSILLEVLKTSLPEGVKLSVLEHLPEHDEARYVPDNQLNELKTLLDSMGGPPKKK